MITTIGLVIAFIGIFFIGFAFGETFTQLKISEGKNRVKNDKLNTLKTEINEEEIDLFADIKK